MTLWTSAEAAKATGGIAQGNWTASGVSIDTRTIETGDLFVALKDARDGHDFVAIALAAGAAAVISPVGKLCLKGEEFLINDNQSGPGSLN